jgi:hypothetical protein
MMMLCRTTQQVEAAAGWERSLRGDGSAFTAVRSLAEAHHGYATLAAVCEATRDTGRMHHYMRALQATADEQEGFAAFMMARLASHGEVGALLEELPEDLFGELHRFLREPGHLEKWRHLRWPHELRTDRYMEAARTLEEMASEGRSNKRKPSAALQQRFLARAKLAMLAGEEATTTTTSPPPSSLVDVDRRLRLCAVQRSVAAAAGVAVEAPAMDAWELVHRCVQAAPGSHHPLGCVLAAFQLLAAEHEERAALSEAAWKAAAGVTDWVWLATQRDGCSDGAFLELLHEQPLGQVAALVYSTWSPASGVAHRSSSEVLAMLEVRRRLSPASLPPSRKWTLDTG